MPSSAPSTPQAHANEQPRLDALYLLNCLSIGGSERKVVRLVNRLTERGTRVGIAYLNGPETLAPLLSSNVPRWHLQRKGKFSFAAARRLAAVVESTRCQTLFTVNTYPTLYAAAARTLLGKRSPRLIALVNTTDFGTGQRWRQSLYKHVLGRFDHVVYGCLAQRESWLAAAEEGQHRSSVIYNGVDLTEFDGVAPGESVQALRLRFGFGQRAFIIGSVGRLAAEKNQQSLIDALVVLRERGIDARLLLVGEGRMRAALERHAATLGMSECVTFTGALHDLRPALAVMDVFVLPSLYVETFSNAALEAMAMGKAVILSDVGGAAEMVRDGIDGRVLLRDDLQRALPEALHAFALDRQLTARAGLAARQRVEARFSFDSMVAEYEQLIGRAPDGDGRN